MKKLNTPGTSSRVSSTSSRVQRGISDCTIIRRSFAQKDALRMTCSGCRAQNDVLTGVTKKLLFFIMLCWHTMALAAISVQVTPSTVQLGEAFRLIFTIENPQGRGVPDLTPLQQNFTIVGTERNLSYSIVNGQTQSSGQWTVLLTAKKTGVQPIPPIQIGRQQSTATSIDVTEIKESTTNDQESSPPDDVILKTEVSLSEPFINQQVIYTVKLYNSQRLLNAEYIPPRVEDALLVPLGDGQRSQTTLNGRGYTVEEQQYAIFPQKSGELKIIAPTFNALVFDTVPRRISARAKTTPLNVKPIPATYSGKNWLPAKQLSLTETYDQTKETMTEGSALVRSITLQAAGVPAQLLPSLKFASSDQFSVYAEKPEMHNTARQQDLVGRAEIKVSYVLNKAGRITIPELQVTWFNTDTGKEEIASLPARTIEIEAANGSVPEQTATTTQSNVKETPTVPPSKPLAIESPRLPWELIGGVVVALVATLTLWWIRRNKLVKDADKRHRFKELHEACVNNNPKRAQAALLRWATLQWPGVELLNLQQLIKLVHDSSFKKQLSLLSQALYSQEKDIKWQGDALWRCVKAHLQTKPTAKNKKSELPPINPS